MKNSFLPPGISRHDWAIIGTLTLVMMGFYGAELSFSVFLKPISREFGWSRAQVSGSLSAVEGIGGLIGIIMGIWTDRYGARILIACGGLVGGLGYLLMSQLTALWQLYLSFGLMVGIAMAACWTPVVATVTRLFVEKRLFVISVVTIGVSLGHMTLPPLSAYLIATQGWRMAYIVLAAIFFASVIPAVALLDNDSTSSNGNYWQKGNPGGAHAMPRGAREFLALESAKTVPFWMLMITGFVTAAGFYFISAHIVAAATDTGIVATSAAVILTFMGIGNVSGKLLVWPIAARMGSRQTLCMLLVLQTLVLLLLIWTANLWIFFALAMIFGFGFGGTSPVRTAMIPEFFGMKSVGTITGLVGFAWAIGGISGPVLAGLIFDLSGSYRIAFLAGGIIMATGVAAAYFLRPPKEPQGKV